MYGAMHLKSTRATPILIVLSVTPVPSVFEIGALLPLDPDGVVAAGVPFFVPLPHAASNTATTSNDTMRSLFRSFTSVPLSCAFAGHYARSRLSAGERD